MEAQVSPGPDSTRNSKQNAGPEQEEETDDFARHLADGARRVRERLTSFVEADSSILAPEPPPLSELPPPPRPNALGILKSKSSRGSLVDRGRGDKENASQSKAKKLLGIRGSSPAPVATSPRRGSFGLNDKPAQSPEGNDEANMPRDFEEKEGVHAGLKAFRQARRELQRMKELEVRQRYQAPQKPPPPPAGRDRAQTTTSTSRPPSQEHRPPPPVAYNRIPSEEARANAGSRAARPKRFRASSGGRSGSRPPRLRNGSFPRDDYHGSMGSPVGPNGKPRQGPMTRALMMHGQDMRRSPHIVRY
ncbi:PHO85 cyclin-1 [Fusarium oxysporum f. sp. albedinis]|nr:PHO85 cyclin-1 [Fusarium oxysporum f. sp. albedinis]